MKEEEISLLKWKKMVFMLDLMDIKVNKMKGKKKKEAQKLMNSFWINVFRYHPDNLREGNLI